MYACMYIWSRVPCSRERELGGPGQGSGIRTHIYILYFICILFIYIIYFMYYIYIILYVFYIYYIYIVDCKCKGKRHVM